MDLAKHSCFTEWRDYTSQTESQQTKSNVGFWYGEKTEKREEKSLRGDKKKRTNNLKPRMTAGQGIQPEPHWWKASALTSALTFLSSIFPWGFLAISRN